jgi:hypoxanthine phosphoribosyltransferase
MGGRIKVSDKPVRPAADEIISPAEIAAGFDRLAAELQPLVEAAECVLLGIMTGGMFPLVHLAERLQGDFLIDYCHATRYAGGTQGHKLVWLARPHEDLAGRTVIVIDDIFDAGTTLHAVARHCAEAGAARVCTAAMVIKERVRAADVPLPDFTTGLRVPDRYVFGCGMDIYGRWRQLQAIYALQTSGDAKEG